RLFFLVIALACADTPCVSTRLMTEPCAPVGGSRLQPARRVFTVTRSASMADKSTGKHIGDVKLKIEPDVLKEIISSGRLSEFASVAAAQAAGQISAQIVDHVAAAALDPKRLSAAAEVSFSYVFEGGDFGTPPHGPHGPRPG